MYRITSPRIKLTFSGENTTFAEYTTLDSQNLLSRPNIDAGIAHFAACAVRPVACWKTYQLMRYPMHSLFYPPPLPEDGVQQLHPATKAVLKERGFSISALFMPAATDRERLQPAWLSLDV